MQRFVLTSLAIAAAATQVACSQARSQPAAAPPPPSVEVTPVAFKPLRQWSEFTGRLEAVDTVEVRPRVSGFIDGVRFAEGARVRKGQVLFQIDPRPYQAEVARHLAELERADAKADLAQANAERGRRLIEQNAVAQSELERLLAEARSARADVNAASAALRKAQLDLSFTRVTSPINGRVSRAAITRGNLVSTSDVLTNVVSDGPIYASFQTDEQTYLKYGASERGKSAPVYLGLMDETGYPHEGRLAFTDNAVDANSGTINGRALFANGDGRFTPGMFARIKLVSSEVETVALAPERALGTDLGKRFVLVLSPQNKIEYRPVELGQAVGELRIIRAGLKPGDQVVVSGLQKVKPGDTVRASVKPQVLAQAELAKLEPAL